MAYVVHCPDLKQIVLDVLTPGFAALAPADAAHLTLFVNDPMDFADFPCVGINLLSDTEYVQSIGDVLGDVTDDEGTLHAGASTLCQQNVEVKLWSSNGDERDRLGRLLKLALFTGRGTEINPGLFLTIDGLWLPRITGGIDEGISVTAEQYPAHTVYTRTYYVTAVTELTLQEAAPVLEDVVVQGTADF